MTLRNLSMHDLIAIARHEREVIANRSDPVERARLLAKADRLRADSMRKAQSIIDDPASSVGARLMANEVLNRKRIERC